MALCIGCGNRRGCRCTINASGLATASGLGTGASPRVISVTCADVKACVATMFEDVGFDYDSGTGKLVVPAGTPAGYVLTANGDGTASWTAP